MTSATTIATKSFRNVPIDRVAKRFYSIECRRGTVTNTMAEALSRKSDSKTKISPLAREVNFLLLRQFFSKSEQPLKSRLTIEEVKAALEPITRAREQAM